MLIPIGLIGSMICLILCFKSQSLQNLSESNRLLLGIAFSCLGFFLALWNVEITL